MHYSDKELEEVLNEYFDDDSYPHAILLNGRWGSGKTYFIQEKYLESGEQINSRDIIYISLYGIQSLKDLRTELYNEMLMTKFGLKIGEISVIGSLMDLVLHYVAENKSLNLQNIIQSLDKIKKSSANGKFEEFIQKITVDPKKFIFMFDDIERAKISPREWMGLVGKLLESYKRKCS